MGHRPNLSKACVGKVFKNRYGWGVTFATSVSPRFDVPTDRQNRLKADIQFPRFAWFEGFREQLDLLAKKNGCAF